MFGNKEGVRCPFLTIHMQPGNTAVEQFHQSRKFLWTILSRAQFIPTQAGQVKHRSDTRRRRTIHSASFDATQPQRRPRAIFRGITAKHIQFGQHRPQLRYNGFPCPFGIRPENGTGRNLIARGKGVGSCSESGDQPLRESCHRDLFASLAFFLNSLV